MYVFFPPHICVRLTVFIRKNHLETKQFLKFCCFLDHFSKMENKSKPLESFGSYLISIKSHYLKVYLIAKHHLSSKMCKYVCKYVCVEYLKIIKDRILKCFCFLDRRFFVLFFLGKFYCMYL